jgi:hypothetical protein
MALLNPPELRPSVLLIVVRYLASRRGQRDVVDRLVATIAPAGIGGANPELDVRRNLVAAIELGLIDRSDDEVTLADGVLAAIRSGEASTMALVRRRVFDDELNTAPWGSQVGARDLTNALSWFLTFPADAAPIQMEGRERSAKELQEADFGPRQAPARDSGDEDTGGWPIGNPNRWNSFRRWACSLGFAWVSPKGYLVPDPTAAVRQALPDILGKTSALTAPDFIDKLADVVPVLDSGRFRNFVESNWRRPNPAQPRLTDPLSDALERMRSDGRLIFDDLHDAPRVTRSDGSTFSHVRSGAKR